jgi:hypothetical protein
MPQNHPLFAGAIKRNLTAPGVISAIPGTVISILCLAPGSITLNNCATVAAASGGNQISGTPATLVAGQVLPLNSSAAIGIVASAVTGAFNVMISGPLTN